MFNLCGHLFNIYFCELAIFLKASKGMLGYLNWKPFLLYLVYCIVLPQKGIGKKNNWFQYWLWKRGVCVCVREGDIASLARVFSNFGPRSGFLKLSKISVTAWAKWWKNSQWRALNAKTLPWDLGRPWPAFRWRLVNILRKLRYLLAPIFGCSLASIAGHWQK